MKQIFLILCLLVIGVFAHSKPIKIQLLLHASWKCPTCDCQDGSWYCWEITSAESNDLIDINYSKRTIEISIDESKNREYHAKFIHDDKFNFPEPTYINSEIVHQSCDVNQGILIQPGKYKFRRESGKIVVTVNF